MSFIVYLALLGRYTIRLFFTSSAIIVSNQSPVFACINYCKGITFLLVSFHCVFDVIRKVRYTS